MRAILSAIGLTLAIVYVIPFLVYGLLSALTGLQPPTEGSATLFLLSVLLITVDVAIAFVLLYSLARDPWAGRWMLCALIWWLMFAVVEVGQAIPPDYSWLDALGGIVAKAVYFPLAALVVVRLLSPSWAVENPA